MKRIIYLTFTLSILFAISALGQSNSRPRQVSLIFKSDSLNHSEIVSLNITGAVFYESKSRPMSKAAKSFQLRNQLQNYSTSFHFIINEPVRADISYSPNGTQFFDYTPRFIISPGDSVVIEERQGKWKFTGRNSAKYKCNFEINRFYRENVLKDKEAQKVLNGPNDTSQVAAYFNTIDSLASTSLSILKKYQPLLSKQDVSIQKFDIIAVFEELKINYLMSYGYQFAYWTSQSKKYHKYLAKYKNPLWNSVIEEEFLNDKSIPYSNGFLDNLWYREYLFNHCILKGVDFSLMESVKYHEKHLKGHQKEWALFHLLNSSNLRSRYLNRSEIGNCIDNVLNNGEIRNKLYREELSKLLPLLRIGNPAFNFSLQNYDGKYVHLSDFQGKVVLLDFWFFQCGNCRIVHPLIDSISKHFDKKKFQVVSVCFMQDEKYKSLWVTSNQKKDAWDKYEYTSEDNVNLWTLNSEKTPAEIIKRYQITGAPGFILIDRYGKLLETVSDPRADKGKDIIEKITKAIN